MARLEAAWGQRLTRQAPGRKPPHITPRLHLARHPLRIPSDLNGDPVPYPQQQWTAPVQQHPAYRPPRQRKPRSTGRKFLAGGGIAAGVFVLLVAVSVATAPPQKPAAKHAPAAATHPKAAVKASAPSAPTSPPVPEPSVKPRPPVWPDVARALAAHGFTNGAGWTDSGSGWEDEFGDSTSDPAAAPDAYRWNSASGRSGAYANIRDSGETLTASGGSLNRGWAIAGYTDSSTGGGSGSGDGGLGSHCWVSIRHPFRGSGCSVG